MGRPKGIRLSNHLGVCLTDEEAEAVERVATFACISASQYSRMAIKRQLIADGMLQHPAANSAKVS
jgi:hypothetical protein